MDMRYMTSEALKRAQKKYYLRNRKSILAKRTQYYQDHIEACRQYGREYSLKQTEIRRRDKQQKLNNHKKGAKHPIDLKEHIEKEKKAIDKLRRKVEQKKVELKKRLISEVEGY